MENTLVFPQKLENTELPSDSNVLPRYLPKRIENIRLHKSLYMNEQAKMIHNNQNGDNPSKSTDIWNKRNKRNCTCYCVDGPLTMTRLDLHATTAEMSRIKPAWDRKSRTGAWKRAQDGGGWLLLMDTAFLLGYCISESDIGGGCSEYTESHKIVYFKGEFLYRMDSV